MTIEITRLTTDLDKTEKALLTKFLEKNPEYRHVPPTEVVHLLLKEVLLNKLADSIAPLPTGKVSAKGKSSGLIVQDRKKSAPYRNQTGSEYLLESEPSNVERLIWGINPVFEKRDASLALIEVTAE